MASEKIPFLHPDQSVYWYVLNHHRHTAELSIVLNQDKQSLGHWMDQLLNKQEWDFEIASEPLHANRLRHLFFEHRNILKTNGHQTFGFGYPLLLEFNPAEPNFPLISPLFIWYLNIRPNPYKPDHWIINRDANYPIVPNLNLCEYLHGKYQIDLKENWKELVKQNSFDASTLHRVTRNLHAELGLEEPESESDYDLFPDQDDLVALAQKRSLLNCGFVGIFPPQFDRIYDFQMVDESKAPAQEIAPSPAHVFSLFSGDPGQEELLRHSLKNNLTVADGASGTGKTFAVASLVSNALSNGQKCLVISSRVAALHQLHDLFIRQGLGNLTFLMDDAMHDKNLLLELLRAESEPKNYVFDEEKWRLALNQCSRYQVQLDERNEALRKPIFGKANWPEMVGLFLKSNRQEGKELLNNQISPQDFTFTESEYQKIREAILISEPLYRKVNTLKHPLKNLHPDLFNTRAAHEGKVKILQDTDDFSKKISQLQHRYIQKLDAYSLKLSEHYESHFQDLSYKLNQIQDKLDDYSVRLGKDFEAGDPGLLSSLYGVFSSKYKTVLQAMEEVATLYKQLLKTQQERKYFDFHFVKESDRKNIEKIRTNINQLSEALRQWRHRLPSAIQEEVQRLSSKTALFDLDYKEQIVELEYALDVLVEEINDAGLFEQPISHKMLTLPKRLSFMEELLEQLESTRQNLRDYDIFYPWHKHWLSLSDTEKRLIQALVKVKPHNWLSAFESWFFHNRLTIDYRVSLPQNEEPFNRFIQSHKSLIEQIPFQIQVLWQAKKKEILRLFRKQNKELYQHYTGNTGLTYFANHPASEVFDGGLEVVSGVFPLFLSTPHVAAEVIPFRKEWYDLVVIDDAHDLDLATGIPLMHLGARVVVMGDHGMFSEDDPKDNLLEYARSKTNYSVLLRHFHRASPAPIALFYKAAFQPRLQLLRPLPGNETCLEEIGLSGSYDESLHINVIETDKILQLIQEIQRTPQQTYPSVGIVCFTKEQRDHIAWRLLTSIQKKEPGSDKIGHLQRNGMSVFYVDEIDEQVFDILIVSMTLGPKSTGAGLCAEVESWNTPDGLRQFHLMCSCARHQVIICHSLPADVIKAFAKKTEYTGHLVLGLLLNYAKAVKSQDAKKQKAILLQLESFRPGATPESPLLNREIAHALQPYLEKGRVHIQTPFDHMVFPVTIKPVYDNQPPFVILTDGWLAEGEVMSPGWEQKLQDEIANAGMPFAFTWSANWWKDPKQEARRMASLIIRQDNLFAPIATPEPLTEPYQPADANPVIENSIDLTIEKENTVEKDEKT